MSFPDSYNFVPITEDCAKWFHYSNLREGVLMGDMLTGVAHVSVDGLIDRMEGDGLLEGVDFEIDPIWNIFSQQ